MRGTIRARGKGRWQIQVYAGRQPDGSERRVARTIHGTRKQADEALARLVLEVEAGRHTNTSTTVAELAAQWLAARESDWSPRTRREYRRQLDRWILPRLGHHQAAKVTARLLDLTYARMAADGAGPATTRVAHTIIRSMFTQAVRWELVPANPATYARPPREPSPTIDPPAPAAVAELLAALDDDPHLSAFVRLAATTGCRRSELCALQWGDIDLDRGSMLVSRALDGSGGVKSTKTGRAKPMALDPATVDALRAWHAVSAAHHLALRAGPPLWVFPADRDLSEPVNPSVMSHRWARARDAVDDQGRRVYPALEGVRLHDLRHFMASRMLAAGVDVRTVANRLGHANPATTLRVYAHLIPEADRAAADDLGKLLDSSG